jgi:Predicted helicase
VIKVDEELIKAYLRKISENYELGISVEATHRPSFVSLIDEIERVNKQKLHALNEAKQIECGSPDVLIFKDGLNIGYVEFKDIGVNLDKVENSKQILGYLKVLPNLLLSNYLEFRWFINGKFIKSVRVASIIRNNKLKIDTTKLKDLSNLLEEFLLHNASLVSSPNELSVLMAHIALNIREILVELIEDGQESDLVNDIRKSLSQIIPEITDDDKTHDFVDMYAQTIVYGLFVARFNHDNTRPFSRETAAFDIPKTSPFVGSLFESVMGVKLKDEPYFYLVENMVAILSNIDADKIMEGFGRNEGMTNPVIYFYETFLNEYDKETRFDRGVFHTPEPIVSYIIQSIDSLLKNKFGIKSGVVDTQKKTYRTTVETIEKKGFGKSIKKNVIKEVNKEIECHKVLFLDPSCGTGTFMYELIRYIRSIFITNNDIGLWPGYVREHLIPRLNGFEILMASYTIAHFNLFMELKGRDLIEDNRDILACDMENQKLNIYLTNTLSAPKQQEEEHWGSLFRSIYYETDRSGAVKNTLPVMVIMGNPPYNARSTNEYDISSYKQIDGEKLNEKTWNSLQDDYVKFIRWAQKRIETTNYGIVAFITNHAYLDNLTFRGMRKSLMDTFDEIYVFDLHGNSSKKEKCLDGSKDENVFNIKQGVAISIFLRTKSWHETTIVKHAELYGTKNEKYKSLETSSVNTTQWNDVFPTAPNYIFKPLTSDINEYNNYLSIDGDIFLEKFSGTQTGNDKDTIAFTRNEMGNIINDFVRLSVDDERIRYNKTQTKSESGWSFEKAKLDVMNTGADDKNIVEVAYRPFDNRYTYFTGNSSGFHRRPNGMMRNLANKDNLAIISVRQVAEGKFSHAFITKSIADLRIMTSNKGTAFAFPLYIYNENSDVSKRNLNFNPEFIQNIESTLNLKIGIDFDDEALMHYVYAILNSPAYRSRYAEFLQYDYPRIPVIHDVEKFKDLCRLGKSLAEAHLLENVPTVLNISYPIAGNDMISKVAYKDNKLFINNTQYFDGVPSEVYNAIFGGHQVVKKWLIARTDRKLEYTDNVYLKNILHSIAYSLEVQKDVDEVIGDFL